MAPTLSARVSKVEEEIVDLKQIAQETHAGVEQLRHVFGLNGDKSVSAITTTWEDLVAIVAAREVLEQRHDAYAAVRADLHRRFRFLSKGKLIFALVGFASTLGWTVVAWTQALGNVQHVVAHAHMPWMH